MRNDWAVAELREYRRKRDPRRTPEPFGGRRGHGQKPTFVVQRHSARSLHYDLRLERDGALASWAVPKGLPREPGSRRLAVHVEDHPLEYATFEGEIPQGQYGGGTVDVYDRGTYEVVEEKRDGTLTFRLDGERLHGLWTLVPPQRAGGAKDRWLLVKRADTEGAEPARRPRYLPMLATLAPDPPRGRGWLFEVKWDGYRTIARLAEGEPLLTSRRGQDLTERFEQVARQLGRVLRVSDAVVDGEVCSLDRHGRPSFQLLQGGKGRLAYFVFDLLELDGEPLLDRPLSERRALLEEILAPHRTVVLSDAFDDDADLLEVARAQGLEGIV